MRKNVLRFVATTIAFACGVTCVSVIDGPTSHLLGRVGELTLPLVMLASSAACFTQTFPGDRGLRKLASFNLLMLSLSGLLFIVGAFSLFITLLVGSSF